MMQDKKREKVLITGASKGIGKAAAIKFLQEGCYVVGLDILPADIPADLRKRYTHYQVDICKTLPNVSNVNILINNAGVQNSADDIEVNLKGTINCTEKYGLQYDIQAIINIASVSAHNGAEFPEYCASKGGMLAYTKNVAKRVAIYGATCNSISPGGVYTDLNDCVLNDMHKWGQILDQTPLKKWATAEEIADWIYFVAVNNKSMTGQDILIDNGEMINHNFIW